MAKKIIEFNGESCSWCQNEEGCPYKKEVMEFTRETIATIIHKTPAYCSGKVTCDYFNRDNDKYYKFNTSECQGQSQ